MKVVVPGILILRRSPFLSENENSKRSTILTIDDILYLMNITEFYFAKSSLQYACSFDIISDTFTSSCFINSTESR